MIKANLKMNVRNRTALFWNLVFPALFIVLFGAIFNNDEGVSLSIGVAGTTSQVSEQAVAAMKTDDALDISEGTEEGARRAEGRGSRRGGCIWRARGRNQPAHCHDLL